MHKPKRGGEGSSPRRSAELSSCNSERKVGISTGSVHSILTEDLQMRRVSAKFVPKLLTEEQKELRKEICKDMLDCANHDPEFMKTIITGDETWVYGYDPETKFQSSQWKHPESPRLKKARQVRSKVKVMLACFLILVALCITNTHQKAKQLTKSTTWRFYVDFVQLCKKAARHVESKKFSAPP